MRRQLRSNSVKKMKVVTPGGRTVMHFKKGRHNHQQCANCGIKLNRVTLDPHQIRSLAKSSRRPERRFPELCVKCSREMLKVKMLGGTLEKKVFG
ncbi:MAG: 50S ribosomal protein L34e [Candidatus Aenigmatarchaeota archaeon]